MFWKVLTMNEYYFIVIICVFFVSLFYYYYQGQHKNYVKKKYKKKVVSTKEDNKSGTQNNRADNREIEKIRKKISFSEKEEFSFLERWQLKIRDAYPDTTYKKMIFILVGIYGFVVFLLLTFTKLSLLTIIIFALCIIFFGFLFSVNRKLKKRTRIFLDNFNDALDVVARGVKSGYMLHDCFELIVRDAHPVVAREFSSVVKDLKIGMNVTEVMNRFSDRVKLKEVRFFSIIIIIQSKTGGNLADIINNLSAVLRQRKEILRKISVASQEAKTQAVILMGLPFALALIFYLMDPAFMAPLVNTTAGNITLVGCLIWVSIGAMIMRSMINFYK